MGAGILDVTTLKIGQSGSGDATGGGDMGIGIMNVTGGTLVVNSLGLGINGSGSSAAGIADTVGTLNLNNAILLVNSSITIGTGTLGGDLNATNSMLDISGAATADVTALNLSGGTLQLTANGTESGAVITAATVGTNLPTTIQIASITNVSGSVQIPLISYTGNDPFGALSLGTYPAGYTAVLVDDTNNSSVDLSITVSLPPPPPPTPTITGISISGTTLNISATNGAVNGQFVLLGTTNLAAPLTNWIPVVTGSFNGSGNLSLSTNIVNPAVPQEFYLLSQP